MSYRVSEKDLKESIADFSETTGVRFELYCAYGSYGVNIMIPNSGGCVYTLIGLGTKKETFQELNMIQRYFCDTDKRFDKYKVSNCIHRDSLNHYEGKKNVSVLHSYTEKKRGKENTVYWCSACGNKNSLTEKDLKKSQIPITWRGLRKQIEILEAAN